MGKRSEPKNQDEFEGPKLPFGWITPTFLVPVATYVFPDILKSNDIPISTRLTIAFAILAVMLFVACIILTLKTYAFAFAKQVLELKVKDNSAKIDRLNKNLERVQAEYSRLHLELVAMVEKSIHSSFDKHDLDMHNLQPNHTEAEES
jgi:hypothetical protein